MRAAMPVAVPARAVHLAHQCGASGLSISAGARGCVLCWGGVPAGRCRLLCVVFPVLCMFCSSYLRYGFFVLLLMPIVLTAWCYIVLLNSMYAIRLLQWRNSTNTRIFPSTARDCIFLYLSYSNCSKSNLFLSLSLIHI